MREEPRPIAKKRALAPGTRRAEQIVASLRAGNPGSVEMNDAFYELDALPPDDVRDALARWVGPLPDLDRLDAATRRAHGLPLRPLRLRTLSVAKDADVLDLGPVAEEQLRLAGKSWDDADLTPEERLDGELEGSFAGTLERRVLADMEAPATPLFDVVLFLEDSGVVFAAGTTQRIALIAYRKVEMRDRRVRVAIEEAIAAPSSAEAAPAKVAAAPARPKKTTKTATTKRTTRTAARARLRPKTTAKKTAKKAAKKPAKKTAKKTAK